MQKESDGNWYEIGNDRAYTKLAQSMREGVSVASICRELIDTGAPKRAETDFPVPRKRPRADSDSNDEPKR